MRPLRQGQNTNIYIVRVPEEKEEEKRKGQRTYLKKLQLKTSYLGK